MKDLQSIVSSLHDYPSPDKLIQDISDEINVIGVGSARLVIQNPNNRDEVLKLGVGIGIKQNKDEIKVWKEANERNIDNLLLPILGSGANNKWIKMPKVTTSYGLNKYHGPYAKKIYEDLKENNIYLREIETCMYESEPRAFDYGALESIKPSKKI